MSSRDTEAASHSNISAVGKRLVSTFGGTRFALASLGLSGWDFFHLIESCKLRSLNGNSIYDNLFNFSILKH